MFWHLFHYRLKTLVKQKSMIFWTLVFPIILGTLFYFAFSNLASSETLKTIKVGVVNQTEEHKNFETLLTSLKDENEKAMFQVKEIKNESDAKKLLEDNKIDGYFILDQEINIFVKTNGLEQSIMKTVVDEYYQFSYMMTLDTSIKKEQIAQVYMQVQKENPTYFVNQNQSDTDVSVVYFYTLIGMVCMYAGFFGMRAVSDTEANLSKKGARFSVSPASKLKTLLVYLLAGFVIHYTEFLILFGYLDLILKIDFGNQLLPILVLAFFGSLAGITFGMVIGASNRKSEDTKTSMVSTISLFCSFLAGMMVIDIKLIIQENIPILARINPVSLVTDGLYALYYYDTLDRFFTNIMYLGLFSVVMVIVSYLFLRRKKYDSI